MLLFCPCDYTYPRHRYGLTNICEYIREIEKTPKTQRYARLWLWFVIIFLLARTGVSCRWSVRLYNYRRGIRSRIFENIEIERRRRWNSTKYIIIITIICVVGKTLIFSTAALDSGVSRGGFRRSTTLWSSLVSLLPLLRRGKEKCDQTNHNNMIFTVTFEDVLDALHALRRQRVGNTFRTTR